MKTITTKSRYPYWFLAPAGSIYAIFFLIPTLSSFFFSMTRWTLADWQFIGLDNFIVFFSESSLSIGLTNTVFYALVTSGLKTILGFFLGVFLCSRLATKAFLRSMIFFPVLLSTIAIGVTFQSMFHPSHGLINQLLQEIGISGPDWLGDVHLALFSVALVDVWKGVGIATVIYIAGIMAIPAQYYEALAIDGGNKLDALVHITFPLARPAMNSVIILSFIGGLRSFDLVWVMTQGGPGFTTDLLASIIYKQYQGGFYGLSTAGNVILFMVVAIFAYPLFKFLTKDEVAL